LASPFLFYNPDKAFVKRVEKEAKEEEVKIKRSLRESYIAIQE
jgi:hypothetical protein